MSQHATVYRADLQLSDIDRNLYGEHTLTLARHPSETPERVMVRLLAFALDQPEDSDHGPLEFARDLWEADEPALWQRDFTGRIIHWIEIGQPDDRRLQRTTARVDRVTVYSYDSSTPLWWGQLAPKLTRTRNLAVWQIPEPQAATLGTMLQRSMQLDVTRQDGAIYVGDGQQSLEITLTRLTRE